MSVKWGRRKLNLLDHPYNTTALNERAVEVPLAAMWLEGRSNVLELGNVLAHYSDVIDVPDRRVVDLYEEAPGVENTDMRSLDVADLGVDTVVAISTFEHVDGNGPGAVGEMSRWVDAAADRLFDLLVTVPIDQNPQLDGALVAGAFRPDRCWVATWDGGWTLRRLSEGERVKWTPRRAPDVWPWTVWIGEWSR